MPWNPKTLEAACASLRSAARQGEFVPFKWVSSTEETPDDGCIMFGCGWGIIGWAVGTFEGGLDWTKRMMPVGCTQQQVNAVLNLAGLTDAEIDVMDPMGTWTYFDQELVSAYNNRHRDYSTFISVSMRLAEFFINVLRAVPTAENDDEKAMVLSFIPQSDAKPKALLLTSAMATAA